MEVLKYQNKVQFAQGEYYHIYNRSINKELVFQQKSVRRRFKRIMKKRLSKFAKIITYGIVEDHYHCVTKPKKIDKHFKLALKKLDYAAAKRLDADIENPKLYSLFISDLHKHANQEFANFFNKSMKRKGHVLVQRFKRKLVDLQTLPYLIAYVHNNPRHHGMVESIEELEDYDACGHSDSEFFDWIKEFGTQTMSELKQEGSLYRRMLDVVQGLKRGYLSRVPQEIWEELAVLFNCKKEDLRKQTLYLLNFDRVVV